MIETSYSLFTTKQLVQRVTGHLRSWGYTGIRSSERWEQDGVHEVWCDQSKVEHEAVRPWGWFGWGVWVSGNNNGCFAAGITFHRSWKGVRDSLIVTVESWDQLRSLAQENSRP